MDLQQVKRNLNKMVVYKDIKGVYKLTACIIRKNKENEFYYQVELADTKNGNSLVYAKLTDITGG